VHDESSIATGRLDHAEYVREEEPLSQISHFEWQRGDSGDDIDAGGKCATTKYIRNPRTQKRSKLPEFMDLSMLYTTRFFFWSLLECTTGYTYTRHSTSWCATPGSGA
jgi:hypothetical protein